MRHKRFGLYYQSLKIMFGESAVALRQPTFPNVSLFLCRSFPECTFCVAKNARDKPFGKAGKEAPNNEKRQILGRIVKIQDSQEIPGFF